MEQRIAALTEDRIGFKSGELFCRPVAVPPQYSWSFTGTLRSYSQNLYDNCATEGYVIYLSVRFSVCDLTRPPSWFQFAL